MARENAQSCQIVKRRFVEIGSRHTACKDLTVAVSFRPGDAPALDSLLELEGGARGSSQAVMDRRGTDGVL